MTIIVILLNFLAYDGFEINQDTKYYVLIMIFDVSAVCWFKKLDRRSLQTSTILVNSVNSPCKSFIQVSEKIQLAICVQS